MAKEYFLSISGVKNNDELQKIEEIFYKIYSDYANDVKLIIGLQVSNKSLNENESNKRQPKAEDIGDLILKTKEKGFIPAIHYFTKENEEIISDLQKLSELADLNNVIIQYNTLPPKIDVYQKAESLGLNNVYKFPILTGSEYGIWKKGTTKNQSGENGLEELLQNFEEMKDVVNYVLLDPSHGRGLSIVLNQGMINLSKKANDYSKIVMFAGGIQKQITSQEITKQIISQNIERFGIDSETGLRNDEDELDFAKIEEYSQGFFNALN